MESNLFALSLGSIADLVALGVFALCIIIGVAKGFTKMLLKSTKKIVSLILAFALCSKVAVLLDNWLGIVDGVAGPIASLLERLFGTELMNTPFNQAATADNVMTVTLVNLIKSFIGEATVADATTLKEFLCPIFSYYVAVILAFVLLLIIIRLIFALITKLLSAVINKIKILKLIDRLLGMVLGALNAFILINVALAIISLLPFGFMETINTAITQSTVISKLSEINLLSAIFELFKNTGFITEILPK